ncbi:TraR/DksA family transcriptional regulator [Duganella qianjiadongensis]|uniref:TraR/DksA family transcriptional regulator n=1 Tax=Duganella qianjiadongensis TaxID=2692176 RepID=A0ABW9VKP1_9BURK|nr:TraR/DksA family transcriptional regulator [Duganella qianjiadongensis]MYM38192.1 TraR/DksA family transcriptional regulator [Duganella qianjiadongensis]
MNGLESQQLLNLQENLRQNYASLLAQLADETLHTAALRRPLPHETQASPADNASQRNLEAQNMEAAAHTLQQLQSVRHALAKFAEASYGLCENCGDPIGYSRLQARPDARLCIACQTRAEQQGRGRLA